MCNLDHALLAGEAWESFLENPGPVVVGTAQGGSCFGASYEFLFNIHHRIKKAGLTDVAPVTFVSAEPYLGHFGLGGVGDSSDRVAGFFDRLGIEGLPNTVINEVRDGEIELESGRVLPFAYSMIVPPFTGVDAVREADGLANAMGFVPVDDEFRHPEQRDVYAAGAAIAMAPAPHRRRVPKTGGRRRPWPGRRADHRRRRCKAGQAPVAADHRPDRDTVLDAGDDGIVFKADKVLGGADHAGVMAGPQAHWAKLAFERYVLASRKRGLVAF